eukprot:m.94106 g.94106  ORF g.94106 m.94106 type:complete len:160 (+) comp8706_c0_seq4:269-748(+)
MDENQSADDGGVRTRLPKPVDIIIAVVCMMQHLSYQTDPQSCIFWGLMNSSLCLLNLLQAAVRRAARLNKSSKPRITISGRMLLFEHGEFGTPLWDNLSRVATWSREYEVYIITVVSSDAEEKRVRATFGHVDGLDNQVARYSGRAAVFSFFLVSPLST